jgi:hypothetical protein
METFIFTFGLLSIITFCMSLGYIIMNKPIKGSCGGINCRCNNGTE